ncbi:MAG: TetR/AcrR family transcriptional regulator [Treponema sp.]|nr:TetR/AcrR family transcriptional regulator [Treponema sp.]
MARLHHSEKTARELILDAAFSFYNEPRLSVFSMNELAAKIGISKPAIYRHFKDKDAVLAAMHEQFVSSLSECLLRVQQEEDGGAVPIASVADVVQFFVEHPYYVNYMIGNLASVEDFEIHLAQELETRGVKSLSGFKYAREKSTKNIIENFDHYVRTIYCGVTIFIFIKGREKLIATQSPVEEAKQFSHNLVSFLARGLVETTDKADILHPLPITPARMAELDSLCTITDDMLPPKNRFFEAFASVIRKYKFNGITVERIADELGMAKSSLYEYFDNKNEMIKTLITKELSLLNTIVKENTVEAQTFSEYLYILIRSEFAFFHLRSSLIPICGWLLMSTADETFFHEFDSPDQWISRLPDPLERPHVGIPLTGGSLVAWVSCLPISLVMQCEGRQLTQEEKISALKKMFDFVQNGIEPKDRI